MWKLRSLAAKWRNIADGFPNKAALLGNVMTLIRNKMTLFRIVIAELGNKAAKFNYKETEILAFVGPSRAFTAALFYAVNRRIVP